MIDRCKERGRLVGALPVRPCTPSATCRPGSTSSSPRAARQAGTPVRSVRWSDPEVVDAWRPYRCSARAVSGRGRQMAAAMALGAQGVWCGSVWLTRTRPDRPAVKEKDAEATARHGQVPLAYGQAGRMLKSAWTEEWGDPDHPDPLTMPLQPY